MPKKVSYWGNTGFTGINTSRVAILDYGDWKAVCIGAKDARISAETILTGQNGILRLNGEQMGFRFKAAAKIDRMAYGLGDGAKVYKLTQELYATLNLKKE